MLFLYKNQLGMYQSHSGKSLKMRFIQWNENIISKHDRNSSNRVAELIPYCQET